MADSEFSDYESEGSAAKKNKIFKKSKKRERRTIMQSLLQKNSC
jgi:hypothetical protein